MFDKAGHKRAFAQLAARLAHYRCPACLDDVRPRIDSAGIHCPVCGETDPNQVAVVEQVATRSGFRWVAHLEPINR